MIAVITGASSGIGREMARELAKRGFNLILVARREERLLTLKNELEQLFPVQVEVFVGDLQHTSECYRLYEFCKNKRVRILVNNAGVGSAGYVTMMSYSEDTAMIQTNLIAVQLLTKLFAKKMNRGIILNVSSMAAFQPGPGMTVYGATKSYIYQFSRAMNYELKKQGSQVRIVTLCPGPVDTEFGNDLKTSKIRGIFTLSAKRCAQIAVDGMLKGKEVIIPGFSNRILKRVTKCMPENIVLFLEHQIQSSKLS